jgi:hypothetical protein
MAWDSKTPSLVTQARLLHMSPDSVYAELKEYAAYQDESSNCDEKLEETLLLRNDPLITLGLAQYGGSNKVATILYKRSTEAATGWNFNKALRLAVLGDSRVPQQIFSSHTLGVVEDEDVLRLINCDNKAEDDRAALHVVLTNPGAKKLLAKLFNQEKPFDTIPEDKFIRAIFWSYSNSAINDDESSEHGPDMYAWDLKKGIRRLLSTLPVTEQAAWAIYCVIKFLDPYQAGMFDGDPTPVIDRWRTLQLSDDFKKYHEGDCQDIDFKQEFLCLIASLFYFYSVDVDNKHKTIVIGDANSPDLALRCAHYRQAKMAPEQMQEAHDKDGDAFTLSALNNEALFWRPDTRAKLESLMRWRLIHRYRRRCEQIKKRKPEFDLTPVSEDGAALLEDTVPQPSEEQKQLERLEALVIANAKQVQAVYKVLTWVVILVIAAIVLIWRPHF